MGKPDYIAAMDVMREWTKNDEVYYCGQFENLANIEVGELRDRTVDILKQRETERKEESRSFYEKCFKRCYYDGFTKGACTGAGAFVVGMGVGHVVGRIVKKVVNHIKNKKSET